MKILLIGLLAFTLVGCEDKVAQPITKVITQPGVNPEENPETTPSRYPFEGITKVESITRTSAHIHWEHVAGFHQYNVISIGNVDRKIIKTVSAPTSKVKLQGLTPDTEYTILVRGLDDTGHLDANTKTISFNTLAWPEFTNQRSLAFNGSQSVSLGASNKLKINKTFTVSMWFKTTEVAADTRLITFHTGRLAGSALSVGLDGNQVQVIYTNKDADLFTKSTDFDYSNSTWHHLALSTNGNIITLYLNGVEKLKIYDSIAKLGRHPATIAAYTGIQKGYIGKIDEVGIFKKFFTQSEAIELFNQGQSMHLGAHSNGNKLVHWYQFGDQPLDSERNIVDVTSGFNGTPLNIFDTDFSTDSP